MRKIISAILISAVVVLGGISLRADEHNVNPKTWEAEGIIKKVIPWLRNKMKVPDRAHIIEPAIMFVNQETFNYFAQQIEESEYVPGKDPLVLAIYMPYLLILNDKLDMQTDMAEAIIVHELVHHFQFARNHPRYVAGVCAEYEAYYYQNIYADEQQLTKGKVSDMNLFLLRAACMRGNQHG